MAIRFAPWWLNLDTLMPESDERCRMADERGMRENLVPPVPREVFDRLQEGVKPLFRHWLQWLNEQSYWLHWVLFWHPNIFHFNFVKYSKFLKDGNKLESVKLRIKLFSWWNWCLTIKSFQPKNQIFIWAISPVLIPSQRTNFTGCHLIKFLEYLLYKFSIKIFLRIKKLGI